MTFWSLKATLLRRGLLRGGAFGREREDLKPLRRRVIKVVGALKQTFYSRKRRALSNDKESSIDFFDISFCVHVIHQFKYQLIT